MSYAGLTWKEIAESSIAIGLIFAFMANALARTAASMRVRRPVRIIVRPRSPIVVPPVRRTRESTIRDVTIDWTAASPQERVQAVLGVLPLHYENENGITATDVAHRLGVGKANRVVASLNTLLGDGRARSHWEFHRGHKRRCYWRTGSPS